ncbi:DEAD/DEAH box helicase [Haloarcula nitratireducens]|uniref:DEAD/DEAH box helicase n=1 Tax=Haloarcula nitratireducens TaxID=2487749 RepID=A0AAW4PI08_9EURY|nr:DEAD/DEAH box helicase [Halomicroarcula nitratireducens]MBX0297660.1 DEAD/DEAH box helicase [Halomicroarcula nitratireducens]
MSTYDVAANSEFLNQTLDELTEEVFRKDIGEQYTAPLSEQDRQRAAWMGSILANSSNDDHRKRALATAVLLYTTCDKDSKRIYQQYLYTILSRLGSLPSAHALNDSTAELVESISDPSQSLLAAELDAIEEYHRLDSETVLTRFQQRVWDHLDEKYVVFSGPTSSGKSFLMQQYIRHSIASSEEYQAVYLVPSRALISEVASEFRTELGELIDIRTSAHLDEVEDSFLLVITPERCLQLFDYEEEENIDLDLVFLDELQQLEDGGRGPLFENVLENLESVWPNTQIIAAGPYIDNPADALEGVVHGEADDIKTVFNPVFQLEARFTFRKRSDTIDVELKSPSGNTLELDLNRPTGLSYSTLNNKKQTVRRFVEEFGMGDQSLAYGKTRRATENMALGVAASRSQTEPPETEGLIEYLERTVHEDYALIEAIQSGVAFHHGSVPQVARDEIETLYRDEKLDLIACTSTLLQGVNLPAQRMYLVDPGKGREKTLSDFEMQNLIGRVGRVGNQLYGTIYYIDRENDEWADQRLNTSVNKEVTAATTNTIENRTDDLLELVATGDTNEITDDGLRYTIVLLRNRYLKQPESIKEYLTGKGLAESKAAAVLEELESNLPEIRIPVEILRKNPTVDPVLQNRLYENVNSAVEPWEVVTTDLKQSFFSVTQHLNTIFHFVADPEYGIEPARSESMYSHNLNHLKYTAYHWLNGRSYNELIDLRQDALGNQNIDSVIKELMRIINDDVRYMLVKYYQILCDIFDGIEDYDNQFMLNFDKRLERGSYESERLQLMDMGIDRSIALDLETPNVDNDEEYKTKLAAQVNSLSPIYRRHLIRNGVLDTE